MRSASSGSVLRRRLAALWHTLSALFLKLVMLISWVADALSQETHGHHERFAKPYELSSILSSQVDGEHILVGVNEFQQILCVKPT